MIKPNLNLAENKESVKCTLYYDVGSKSYGIRQAHEIVKDGVHVYAEKSIDMSLEELEQIVEKAKNFIGVHKKY